MIGRCIWQTGSPGLQKIRQECIPRLNSPNNGAVTKARESYEEIHAFLQVASCSEQQEILGNGGESVNMFLGLSQLPHLFEAFRELRLWPSSCQNSDASSFIIPFLFQPTTVVVSNANEHYRRQSPNDVPTRGW